MSVWTVRWARTKRDRALTFTGSRMDVAQQVEALATSRRWVVDIDVFTDQVEAYRLANSRRRRWLVVMPS